MRLEGKVCVITGAGSGIGRAASLRFAREGARVLAADVSVERAQATCGLAAEAGAQARAIAADVSRSADVQRMLRDALDAWGHIDVLVNNAGFGIAATVEETAEDDWDRLMAVNLKGVYLGCKHVIPIMRSQGSGVIISTASSGSLVGIRNRAAYCASKGAVAALTRAMAIDHAKDGIRVNCVAPGTIDTPYFAELFANSSHPQDLRRNLEARQIMNRLGSAEEIANAMLFLACDESTFVTGSTLVVDGGMTAW